MKEKFVLGVLTGVSCSAIAFAIFFSIYVTSFGVKQRDVTKQAFPTSSPTTEGEEASQAALMDKLEYIKNLIKEKSLYDFDETNMENGIFNGIMMSVDDLYATYFSPEEFDAMLTKTSGSYCGIGTYVTQDPDTGEITIVDPYPGGPADKAGVLDGDILLGVDGYLVTGMNLVDVTSIMKGPEGTSVNVVLSRNGETEPIVLDIVRENVEVPIVEYELLDDKTGYIYVGDFSDAAANQFITAVDDLISQETERLVIDIRSNHGGLVTSAVKMLDRLLPPGLLVYTEDKKGERIPFYATNKDTVDLPIAVLVNETSASASEIFAGALQDYQKAKIVGVQTYGKGIVQNLFSLPDQSAVRLTISEYYTPNGNCVHKIGITPDINVVLAEELYEKEEFTKEEDNQLQAAIKSIK